MSESTLRRRGRPRHGRIVIHHVRLRELPVHGNITDMARALGVRRSTIHQWLADADNEPLKYTTTEKGRRMLARRDVVAYLKRTKRLRPRREDDDTDTP